MADDVEEELLGNLTWPRWPMRARSLRGPTSNLNFTSGGHTSARSCRVQGRRQRARARKRSMTAGERASPHARCCHAASHAQTTRRDSTASPAGTRTLCLGCWQRTTALRRRKRRRRRRASPPSSRKQARTAAIRWRRAATSSRGHLLPAPATRLPQRCAAARQLHHIVFVLPHEGPSARPCAFWRAQRHCFCRREVKVAAPCPPPTTWTWRTWSGQTLARAANRSSSNSNSRARPTAPKAAGEAPGTRAALVGGETWAGEGGGSSRGLAAPTTTLRGAAAAAWARAAGPCRPRTRRPCTGAWAPRGLTAS